MEDTDRCGRAGADGGRAAVAAGRLAVCLRGRVQSHGVLGDAALAAVVLRGECVRCRKLCRDAVLWGRELGGVIGLGHRFWGVGGLLVTLGGREREEKKTKIKVGPLRFRLVASAETAPSAGESSRRIRPRRRLEGPLITANEGG